MNKHNYIPGKLYTLSREPTLYYTVRQKVQAIWPLQTLPTNPVYHWTGNPRRFTDHELSHFEQYDVPFIFIKLHHLEVRFYLEFLVHGNIGFIRDDAGLDHIIKFPTNL